MQLSEKSLKLWVTTNETFSGKFQTLLRWTMILDILSPESCCLYFYCQIQFLSKWNNLQKTRYWRIISQAFMISVLLIHPSHSQWTEIRSIRLLVVQIIHFRIIRQSCGKSLLKKRKFVKWQLYWFHEKNWRIYYPWYHKTWRWRISMG